jgi:hypothetical protein
MGRALKFSLSKYRKLGRKLDVFRDAVLSPMPNERPSQDEIKNVTDALDDTRTYFINPNAAHELKKAALALLPRTVDREQALSFYSDLLIVPEKVSAPRHESCHPRPSYSDLGHLLSILAPSSLFPIPSTLQQSLAAQIVGGTNQVQVAFLDNENTTPIGLEGKEEKMKGSPSQTSRIDTRPPFPLVGECLVGERGITTTPLARQQP